MASFESSENYTNIEMGVNDMTPPSTYRYYFELKQLILSECISYRYCNYELF